MLTCVIGGGGFIGKHVASQLVESGRDVLVVGRRDSRPIDLHSSAKYLSFDYANRQILREVLKGCGEIVDMAYATTPQASFVNPILDISANVPATVGLLEESLDLSGLRRILVVSSGGTVYGETHDLPIRETAPTRPVSPYGITKLAIERYACMYHQVRGLPVVIVRPANAYGLGQKPFTGQGFIATAMGCIAKRQAITVFGESGTIRDYVHVVDVASGIVDALTAGNDGDTYNIGSGVGLSNIQIIEAISPLAQVDGYEVKTSIEPMRKFDVSANILDSSLLWNQTGWTPKVGLANGLVEMWRDIRMSFDFTRGL